MLKNGYKVKKLVTTLMTNTKGEGSGGDPFLGKSPKDCF